MDRTIKNTVEMWGGVECTVNRVGENYFDQLQASGHAKRNDDLELFAELGIQAIRYPVLWERVAPAGLASADWSWVDDRLRRLRKLELTPIVGLVHHGSGPASTKLTDSSFVRGLTEYARTVARRYPWVDFYCPVNEPLTTARFSGLYGHWFPHGRNDRTFARCVVNQCRAIASAMQAIRDVNPSAKLVQTEDLSKTYTTPSLRYQAEFENERRWMTADLLCGKLTPGMCCWDFLRYAGISADELHWFVNNPCPPDILGCNYYVVGERLLDERLELYPPERHGGNGRDRYVDVEAVRVANLELAGWQGLLRDAWDRFHIPLALTEVHIGCHREAQLAWLIEAWDAAHQLYGDGIDVRAVTAWSLLGSYNWNTLVTQDTGHYESGVYEVNSNRPRATALATAVRELSCGKEVAHSVLGGRPWWRRSDRFYYPSIQATSDTSESATRYPNVDPNGEASRPPILIVGGRGTLGAAFENACMQRYLSYSAILRSELDVTDFDSVCYCVAKYRPWAVINATGYTDIDNAEMDAVNCYRTNVDGATNLAKACRQEKICFLTFSSDLVFDGTHREPYVEADRVCPLSIYGHSKAIAECQVMQFYSDALIVRTAGLFGPRDERGFLTDCFRCIRAGRSIRVADDWHFSPTYLPDLVHRCLDLLIDRESGTWHLTGQTVCSWADLAIQGIRSTGLDERFVQRCRGTELGLPARRPHYSALGTTHGLLLPSLEEALQRCCEERRLHETNVLQTATLMNKAY
jgi:dTDP-4-dehydrorhamnose reductase